MNRHLRTAALPAVACLAALTLSACGSGNADSDSGGTIVLGATLSLTGNLGSIGSLQKVGYEHAEAEANAAGGIKVGGQLRKIDIKIEDNRSDPTTASQQARNMVLKEDAVALLGACTTPIITPVALVAEQLAVPFVSSCAPTGAFASASDKGWKNSWNFFFSEQEQARTISQAVTSVASNKKVALFTDNEPDGVFERPLYKAALAKAGATVVGDFSFPVGTTDYSSFINEAKSRGAQIVVAQMIPPDGVALWKQMKALQFSPVVGICAKGADQSSWNEALGDVADGTLLEGFWSPTAKTTGTAAINASLGKKLTDATDLTAAVITYSVARVYFGAVTKAGSTELARVNGALKSGTFPTPLGDVKFSAEHTAVTPYFVYQWQRAKAVQVFPAANGGTIQIPVRGLS